MVVREAAVAGEVERSRVQMLTGYEERAARMVTSALVVHRMFAPPVTGRPYDWVFRLMSLSAGSRGCIRQRRKIAHDEHRASSDGSIPLSGPMRNTRSGLTSSGLYWVEAAAGTGRACATNIGRSSWLMPALGKRSNSRPKRSGWSRSSVHPSLSVLRISTTISEARSRWARLRLSQIGSLARAKHRSPGLS